MSEPRKNQAPPNDGRMLSLLRLKAFVQRLPDEEADALFALSESLSATDWRAHLKQRYGLVLPLETQVAAYREWHQRWRSGQHLNGAVEVAEQEQVASGKSPEEARREVIELVYAWAKQQADPKLALAAVDRDLSLEDNDRKEREYELKVATLALAQQKFKLLEEKVKAAQKEKPGQAADKGGLSPETLRQIEAEADLL